MIMKRHYSGSVRFAITPQRPAGEVRLAGSFTQWRPILMRRQRGNRFVAEVPLAAGTYDYKFIVDGRWQVDPINDRMTVNPFGTVHSRLQV